MQRNEMTSFAGIETELKCLILSKTKQIQRNNYHVFPIICGIIFLKKIHKLERYVIVGMWASGDREGSKNG